MSSKLSSPILVRSFIYDRLYHPSAGYFCTPSHQIGSLKTPLSLPSMIGYDDYQKFLSDNYPKNAWLTPSELFRPYYGFTIANYIHRILSIKRKEGLVDASIIEIGGGGGSAMGGILDFFQNYDQYLYRNLEFKVVEISPQMCEAMEKRFKEEHRGAMERGNLKIVNSDFLKYKKKGKELQFLIFLEVLDNMPHDRVYWDDKKKNWEYQAMVETDEDGNNAREIKVDIQDDLIKEMLSIYKKCPKELDDIDRNKYEKGLVYKFYKYLSKAPFDHSLFLPTFCLKVLKHINKEFPNHSLIMSDFDMLKTKESVKEGINAPIVSKKLEKSHEKYDFQSYLVKRGEADIFFPTNFLLLSHMYSEICKKPSMFMKSYEFVNEFSKEKWGETKSGYNPLKEDFMNTSFFLTK